MSGTRKLVLTAVLSAAALGIFLVEAQLPAPVPIPGVKLGLANIITLVAMSLLGRRSAAAVLGVRLLLGSMFTGSVSALLYSAAGGVLAYAVMAALIGAFPRNMLWVVSILAAIAHNAGQLAMAAAITATPGILWYGPALLIAAVLTGAFTGLAAIYLLKGLEKLPK